MAVAQLEDRNFNLPGVGIVDGRDYIIWAENYTGSAPLGAFPVPEPSTIMLGVVGALACFTTIRRRRA